MCFLCFVFREKERDAHIPILECQNPEIHLNTCVKTFKHYFNITENAEFFIKDPFQDLEDKTLIFFDTETTGFSPHTRQVTEIAAISVSGKDFKQKETFQRFIKLSPRTHRQIKWQAENPPDPEDKKAIRKRGKSIEELLQMTDYQEDKAVEGERKVLYDFMEFVRKHNNPVLVAHNARFDMKMVMTKLNRYYRYNAPRFKVLDTLKFSRLFLLPAIQSLTAKGDKDAEEMLELLKNYGKRKNFISSSLGNLNQLVKDRLQKINWHSGLSDVQVTVELFGFIRDYWEQHKGELDDPVFRQEYAKAHRKKF